MKTMFFAIAIWVIAFVVMALTAEHLDSVIFWLSFVTFCGSNYYIVKHQNEVNID